MYEYNMFEEDLKIKVNQSSQVNNINQKICIGCDLGTTFTCFGVWDNNLKSVRILEFDDGKNTMASSVAFKGAERLVGNSAKKLSNSIYGVKRLIGKTMSEIDVSEFNYKIVPDQFDNPLIEIVVDGKTIQFRPEEISAMILSEVKKTAIKKLNLPKDTVVDIVITTPAYFNDAQRNATKRASEIAGLNCVRIINEPTAACLCYGLNDKYSGNGGNGECEGSEDHHVLIFDLGGGTFDVSIVKINSGIFEVKAVNGDTHLGGEDFDNCLINFIIEKIDAKMEKHRTKNQCDIENQSLFWLTDKLRSKIKLSAEKIKIQLSKSMSADFNIDIGDEEIEFTIHRKVFEKMCEELFNKTKACLNQVLIDAELDKSGIDEVVLVGGSTRIPKIQEILSNYFNGKPLNNSVNPDEAVAFGASVQGAILSKSDNTGRCSDLVLLDVIPLSLGVKLAGGKMRVIISRNSGTGMSKTELFTTNEDNQRSVDIEIFEGERIYTSDCHFLGKFTLNDIPKGKRGTQKIEVTFHIDENGILVVSAIETSTKTSSSITIGKETGRLSAEEVERMIADAEKYRIQDDIKRETLEVQNSLISYVQQQQTLINNVSDVVNSNGNGNENGILSIEDISICNKLLLSTLEWLENSKPTIEEINNCRLGVEYNLKPFIQKIYSISGKTETNENPENDIENIQNVINGI